MDKGATEFLNRLKDGKWHRKNLWADGVGIATIEACVHLRLAEKKLTPVGKMKDIPEVPDHWKASFRITARGRQFLKTGKGPTREELTRARCYTTCTHFFCRHRR